MRIILASIHFWYPITHKRNWIKKLLIIKKTNISIVSRMSWRHIMDIHFFPVFFLLYSLRVWKSSIRTCYKHFITRQDCIVDYHLLLTSFNSAEKTNKQKMKKKNSSSSVIFLIQGLEFYSWNQQRNHKEKSKKWRR